MSSFNGTVFSVGLKPAAMQAFLRASFPLGALDTAYLDAGEGNGSYFASVFSNTVNVSASLDTLFGSCGKDCGGAWHLDGETTSLHKNSNSASATFNVANAPSKFLGGTSASAAIATLGFQFLIPQYQRTSSNIITFVMLYGADADKLKKSLTELFGPQALSSVVILRQQRTLDGRMTLTVQVNDDAVASNIVATPAESLHAFALLHSITPAIRVTVVTLPTASNEALLAYLAHAAGVSVSTLKVTESAVFPDGSRILQVQIFNAQDGTVQTLTVTSPQDMNAVGAKQWVIQGSSGAATRYIAFVSNKTTCESVFEQLASLVAPKDSAKIVPRSVRTYRDGRCMLQIDLAAGVAQQFASQLLSNSALHGIEDIIGEVASLSTERTFVVAAARNTTTADVTEALVRTLNANASSFLVSDASINNVTAFFKLQINNSTLTQQLETFENKFIVFPIPSTTNGDVTFTTTNNMTAAASLSVLASAGNSFPAALDLISCTILQNGMSVVRAHAGVSALVNALDAEAVPLPTGFKQLLVESRSRCLRNTFIVAFDTTLSLATLRHSLEGLAALAHCDPKVDMDLYRVWTFHGRQLAQIEVVNSTVADALNAATQDSLAALHVAVLYREAAARTLLFALLHDTTDTAEFIKCVAASLHVSVSDVTVMARNTMASGESAVQLSIPEDGGKDPDAIAKLCGAVKVYAEEPPVWGSIIVGIVMAPNTLSVGITMYLSTLVEVTAEDLRIIEVARMSDNNTFMRVAVSSESVAAKLVSLCDEDLLHAGVTMIYIEGRPMQPMRHCTGSSSFAALNVSCNASLGDLIRFLSSKLNVSTMMAVQETACRGGTKTIVVSLPNSTGVNIGELPTDGFDTVGIYSLQSNTLQAQNKSSTNIWIIISCVLLLLLLLLITLVVVIVYKRMRRRAKPNAQVKNVGDTSSESKSTSSDGVETSQQPHDRIKNYVIPEGDQLERHLSRVSVRSLAEVKLQESNSMLPRPTADLEEDVVVLEGDAG